MGDCTFIRLLFIKGSCLGLFEELLLWMWFAFWETSVWIVVVYSVTLLMVVGCSLFVGGLHADGTRIVRGSNAIKTGVLLILGKYCLKVL